MTVPWKSTLRYLSIVINRRQNNLSEVLICLNSGADQSIAIRYRRVSRFTENTGMLMSSGKRVTFEYVISLTNNRARPVLLVVADQIPISRHQSVVVTQLAPLKTDADGRVKWTQQLAAGAKLDLTLKFKVEYPNDFEVSGLD